VFHRVRCRLVGVPGRLRFQSIPKMSP
jgi:hypothetical protein